MTDSDTRWRFLEWARSPGLRGSLRELAQGEPRSASVLAGSLIDDLLARAVGALGAGRPAGGSEQAASDYAARCLAVRLAGLISESMVAELRTLGHIRNEFAHSPSPEIDFDSTDVFRLVAHLRSPARVARDLGVDTRGTAVRAALQERLGLGSTGNRFWWLVAVMSVLGVLGARLESVGAQARSPLDRGAAA